MDVDGQHLVNCNGNHEGRTSGRTSKSYMALGMWSMDCTAVRMWSSVFCSAASVSSAQMSLPVDHTNEFILRLRGSFHIDSFADAP
jgi:hypothetical protein